MFTLIKPTELLSDSPSGGLGGGGGGQVIIQKTWVTYLESALFIKDLFCEFKKKKKVGTLQVLQKKVFGPDPTLYTFPVAVKSH